MEEAETKKNSFEPKADGIDAIGKSEPSRDIWKMLTDRVGLKVKSMERRSPKQVRKGDGTVPLPHKGK